MDSYDKSRIFLDDSYFSTTFSPKSPSPPSSPIVLYSLQPLYGEFNLEDSFGFNHGIFQIHNPSAQLSNEQTENRAQFCNFPEEENEPGQEQLSKPANNLADTQNFQDIDNLREQESNTILLNPQSHLPTSSQLERIITYLVQNSRKPLQQIHAYLSERYQKHRVIDLLVQKFSSLKKTKEELTKYCMRKAFKFMMEHSRSEQASSITSKQDQISYKRSKNVFLKKVSSQKSMNSRFLKDLFSQPEFLQDYHQFLDNFNTIILQDNQRKIKYLAQMLSFKGDPEQNNQKAKGQIMRRLPWTERVLTKVRALAGQLLKFAQK